MQHFTASDSPYQREKHESAALARPSTYTGRYQPASKPKSAPIRAIMPAYGTYPPSDYAPVNAKEDIPIAFNSIGRLTDNRLPLSFCRRFGLRQMEHGFDLTL